MRSNSFVDMGATNALPRKASSYFLNKIFVMVYTNSQDLMFTGRFPWERHDGKDNLIGELVRPSISKLYINIQTKRGVFLRVLYCYTGKKIHRTYYWVHTY